MSLRLLVILALALAALPWLVGKAKAQDPPGVQILGMADLAAAPAASGTGPVILRHQACVRVTGGLSRYRVRIDATDGQSFVLRRSGSADQVPFSIVWDADGAKSRLDAPGPAGLFDVSGISCGTDAHAVAYEVQIARADLHKVMAGEYHAGIAVEIALP